MTTWSREAFAAVVRAEQVDLGRAALLLAAEFDPQLDAAGVERSLVQLDGLAAAVPGAGPPAARLRPVLGGFGGGAADYQLLESSLLHRVLDRRRGLPILLSLVWTEVASRAGIDADLVGLPGHFVVGLEGGLVDPFAGGTTVAVPVAVRPWGAVETLARVLANIRAWAGVPERWPQRLRALDLALLLPRHDAALRRERGELAVRLGDFAGGATDLETYADAVEPVEPQVAEAVRRSARSARARLN